MKKGLIALGAWLLPIAAFAQDVDLETKVEDFEDILNLFLGLINIAVPLIIALAVLYFIWGVFKYVVSDTDEDKKKGKSVMMWGIIGIFVMVSVWGLVNILRNTFDLTNDAPAVPELPDINVD